MKSTLVQYLTINDESFLFKDILSLSYKTTNPYSKKVLNFCHAWLNEEPLYDLHTSGSTGTPKKIQVTRTQLIASALMTQEALSLKEGASALVCLHCEFIAGIMMLVRGLVCNLQLNVVTPCRNPFLGANYSYDFLALTPLQIAAILQNDTSTQLLNLSDSILIGGAPISPSLKAHIQSSLDTPKIYQTYGMTETVSHIALKNISKNENEYHVLSGVKVEIDHRSCLRINSPTSHHRWVQTNDIVSLLSPTSFEWKGRADFVINSGGVKLHPEIIEEKIAIHFDQLQLNNRFFVAGIHDEQLGERLVLLIEGSYRKDLLTELKNKLPRYECPKELFFLDKFIDTPTGKIKREENLKRI